MLFLLSIVAVFQPAAQQTKIDQKPIGEIKAKAEAGDANSELELGLRYDNGDGVAKDPGEAAKWLRKAAEQNVAQAQFILGVFYAMGKGVAKDQVEEVKWFRKAGEQNHAYAQYRLGICYAEGEGVAKDYVEAYKWELLAAGQGDEDAKKTMTVFESKMTPKQIAKAQNLARDFKPR